MPAPSVNASPRSDVLVERAGHLMIITLNRPEVRNALTADTFTHLAEAFAQLDADPVLRAAVLTGAGGHFCAGMDLAWFSSGGQLDLNLMRSGRPVKPLIAAVEGYALAGGLEVALLCDLIVASSTSQLGIPEVKRGLYAAAGGVLRLPSRIPYHLAMQMALTGDPIDGRRAYEIGLVNELCDTGQAVRTAIEFARRIAANSPIAVTASKELVKVSGSAGEDAGWDRSDAIFHEVFSGPDAIEGPRAFVEKREPTWADQTSSDLSLTAPPGSTQPS